MSARPSNPARAAVVALVAASCAVGPDYVRPEPPRTAGYTAAGTPATLGAGPTAQRLDGGGRLAPDWWRLLRNAPLDRLVTDALVNSPTLEAAQATLRRSQESLRAGYGVFFPQADASASAARQRFSPQRFGSAVPASVFNLFTLSGTVSYTLDIWGGQRRAVEGLRAQVDAQRYQLLGATIMLAGNVVTTAIAVAAYQAQLDATQQLIVLEEDQVRLGKAQAEAGTIPYVNLLSLESQIALTRATLPPLAQKIDQGRHLLAALTGRLPGDWTPPAIALDDLTLPADVPVSLPSALVRQRPDILIAEAQLHASTAQIGVATAAMLPNVTLSGGYGTNSTQLGNLGSDTSLFWSLVGGVTQPIFHGGALFHQRKAAVAGRDQAAAAYREAVLSAFQQVADGLRALDHDAAAVEAEQAAQESAEAAFKLTQIDYNSGLVGYLQVLTANAQYLQSRLGFIQAQAQRIQDTVALFVALGGGWWNQGA